MYDVPSTVRPPTLAERIEFIALPVLAVLLTLVSALAVEHYSYLWGSDRALAYLGPGGRPYQLHAYSVLIGLAIGLSQLIALWGMRWWAKGVWIVVLVAGASVANWAMENSIYQQWQTHTLGPRAIAWLPASHAILWSLGIIGVPQVLVIAMHRRHHLWWIMVGTTLGWMVAWVALSTLFQETIRSTDVIYG